MYAVIRNPLANYLELKLKLINKVELINFVFMIISEYIGAKKSLVMSLGEHIKAINSIQRKSI